MRRIIIIFLIIGSLVIFINIFQKEVKNFFYLISSPFQKTLWRAGDSTSDFFTGIFQSKVLTEENNGLRQKVQQLLSEVSFLKELKVENEFLRKALNLGLANDFEMKMAEIIGKDVSQDSLIINLGKKDGIIAGSPVIISEKVLVGRIGEVLEDFSKVVLITSKESSFDAKVLEKDIHGLAKGRGDLTLALEFLPKEKEIKEGDFIVTSALGGIFPQGLLIGQVKEVLKSDLEPFQKIKLAPAFKINDLDIVFVITAQ